MRTLKHKELDEVYCFVCDKTYNGKDCPIHSMVGVCQKSKRLVTLDDYGNCPFDSSHSIGLRRPKYEVLRFKTKSVLVSDRPITSLGWYRILKLLRDRAGTIGNRAFRVVAAILDRAARNGHREAARLGGSLGRGDGGSRSRRGEREGFRPFGPSHDRPPIAHRAGQ